MANITISIPDNLVTRVSTGLGYETQIPGPDGTMIANPQTRGQYCKQWLINAAKKEVIRFECELVNQTHAETIQLAIDKVNTEVTLS